MNSAEGQRESDDSTPRFISPYFGVLRNLELRLEDYTISVSPRQVAYTRPSRVGDKVVGHLQRPGETEASAEGSHGHLADVVAGQFQRALAPNPGLGIS